MSRFLRARALGAAIVASVAVGGCSDPTVSPAAAPPLAPSRDVVIPGDTGTVVAIARVSLPSTTLTIGAPPVLLRTTVISKIASFFVFRVRARVLENQQAYTAFEVPIPCGEGQVTCTFATSLALPAGVVSGPAQLELQVINSALNTLVQRLLVPITLVGNPPTINALTVSADTVVIGGSTTRYTATLKNPESSRPNMIVSGNIRQNPALRAAGDALVQCGGGAGVLPTGSCTVSNPIVASNSGGGTALVPGSATFELQLRDTFTGVVFDTKTVAITLVSSTPTIAALTLSTDTLVIGSSSVPYTATLRNPGPSLSNVRILSSITQGTTSRAGAGLVINCGSGSGVLPTAICTVSGVAVASNFTSGSGTLEPGGAIFSLQLVDANGKILDTTFVKVILTSPGPADPVDGL